MADKIPVKANYTGADVTSLGEFAAGDTVPVANGGTGATTAAGALTNLGAAALAGNASQSFSMLNGTVAGTLSLTGAASTLGYDVGAGGTVTQATSKSTTITLNKSSGRITMNNEAMAAGAVRYFTVLNSLITASSSVVLTGVYVAVNPASYRIELAYSAAGQFAVRITNITAGSLSEELQLQFGVFSGAVA